LAFSYWIDNLGFITEGKLAAIFIKPSLGVSNWPVIYFINYKPTNTLAPFITVPSVVSPQGGASRGWAAPPHGEAGPWPSSGSRSVFGPLLGKIRLLELVSSNFENIFCVAFLKHKNSRKQGAGTVASCQ
jgi:hypothetical protein